MGIKLNKIYMLICTLLITCIMPSFQLPAYAQITIRIRPKQCKEDMSHDYFVCLLRLALDKTKGEYSQTKIVITDFNVTQGRALTELAKRQFIDVDWAATNNQREKLLEPIRIPLLGGLLGYRAPVITKKSYAEFSKIKNIEQLQKFVAIQGTHWPDTIILKNAGIKVYTTPQFGLMYKILAENKVNFFPRGINEIYAEFESLKYKNLILYDSLLISYTMPMYFFTNKRNKPLARRIEKGLKRAITDGSFLQLVKTHPATSRVFPLSKYDNSIVIKLSNPDLPKKTPVNNATLWFKLGKQAH